MAGKTSGLERVRAAAEALGLPIEIVTMPDSTRTAEEAAAACGCPVGAIVKSLVFVGRESRRPILMLVSGVNRVDEEAVARDLGEAVDRPDARFVREVTGFAIGGVAPFGHATPLATRIDRALLAHDRVWAAAGTPHAVFSVDPRDLAGRIGAEPIDLV
ncbi:YbaK/EbsC family protein [Prosthecomicrobium sp. N25]|uniref:YbaK/EbsC family protein n=1 Tax=Prosthecomicrobium sp. N25 TaxID=3129254 RepID=UPI0030788D5E